MSPSFTLLRRLAVFALALLVLAGAGLALLLFRWWGERGAPPAGRLYVAGDFAGGGPLAVLHRLAEGNACYAVETAGAPAPRARVCRGDPERVWVEDALLQLSVGARGVPRVSIAGLRARPGDLIGSLADGKRPHPRYPLRAYGVPATAARVVTCPDGGSVCLEVLDRGGRLAVVRAGGRIEKPGIGERLALSTGDALWLGLVAFDVEAGDGAVALRRVDRLRSRRGGSRRSSETMASDLGGDRRWLGRLWHVESPDPGPEVPERFEVHPLRVRYTTHNLSRQRTNFEGEDVLQRLIDGGWLCLDGGEVVWRPLGLPGCARDGEAAAVTRSAMTDYQRARYGDLAHLASTLVDDANASLADGRYLEDPTALPFAFDWRLAGPLREGRPPRPVAHRLWGVRFGVTRQIRRLDAFNLRIPPTVVPRDTTGRHLVQALRGDDLVSSFYLPAGAARGSICLGRHVPPEDPVSPPLPEAYRPTSGGHHPLGSVAFTDDPRQGTWTADPDAACEGCRLALEVVAEGGESRLALRESGDCELLGTGPEDGERRWGPYRLRVLDRGRPWLAATDPGTRRRHFAEELYLHGGLRPLLGDEAGLSGVEAAIQEYLRDSGEIGVEADLATLELTVDGDLQLAAATVVDALARRHVTAANDPEPGRVSVTAAVLDAAGGDLLAAVSWSRRGSERARKSDWQSPSSWELGSGQADVLENGALLRRGAVGSTLKITGAYALLNNGGEGLVEGEDLTRSSRDAFLEAGDRGRLHLDRGGLGRPSGRSCSTGPHYLPASGRGFTSQTFVRRFAESCNNFFVLTGFRHAGSRPARLGRSHGAPAGRDELLIDVRGGAAVLVEPPESEARLVERIREGLAADAAAELPRSLYGVFVRLGFQPRPDLYPARGEAPAELAFADAGRRVAVPLVNDWFSPQDGVATPALEPGRDFAYPGVPSPGRLDKSTVKGVPALELYDGDERPVRRGADDGRTDVQYSMLMIGQSSVEASALGLAALYAPAARADGRAVSPCLFRANCGARRAGARVIQSGIDGAAAGDLNAALRAVFREGTARGGLARIGLAGLAERGWGGKTGTYQVERRVPALLSREQWTALRAWACGVEDIARPRLAGRGAALASAPAGSALGARTCEEADLPLNPAGVHGYGDASLARQLDELAAELEATAEKKTEVFHSFVALAPPARGGWPAVDNPAQGIVVAVLVDRETEDEKALAVQIGGELAAAVERWAAVRR